MEAEYRYVYDDLSGIAEPDDDRDTEPSTRYRVENGRLVYDPEPLPALSAPRIDEERCVVRYQYRDDWDVKRVGASKDYLTKHWPSATVLPVRVLDAASYEAMRADLAETHRLSEIATEMDMRIASLTRERDEAREKLAEAKAVIETSRGSYEAAMAPPPASGPDEGWMNQLVQDIVWIARGCVSGNREIDIDHIEYSRQKFLYAIRKHAAARHTPAPRYPEVCEFLDAASCPMIVQYPTGKWFAQGVINGAARRTGFHDTLAAACRAALDAKERADGS